MYSAAAAAPALLCTKLCKSVVLLSCTASPGHVQQLIAWPQTPARINLKKLAITSRCPAFFTSPNPPNSPPTYSTRVCCARSGSCHISIWLNGQHAS